MSRRAPLLPHDTLQIHCMSCGRFLQAWIRYDAQERISGLGVPWPLPAKTAKGVRAGMARPVGDFERGGGSTERTVLLHRCRAHNNRELPTMVNRDKVTKLLDEKVRRVDW